MAYAAVDEDKTEWIYEINPHRNDIHQTHFKSGVLKEEWSTCEKDSYNEYMRVELTKGSIEKLIGKKLTWEDDPVELKGEDNGTN